MEMRYILHILREPQVAGSTPSYVVQIMYSFPCFRDLHGLPVVACIRFKMMAYKAVNGTAPDLQALVSPHTPAQALCVLALNVHTCGM